MNHSDMDELYELYLMGVLESEQADEIAAHLNEKCDHCTQRLNVSGALLASMASLADVTVPPPELRERIVAMVSRRQPAPPRNRVLPVAFALALAGALLILAFALREHSVLQHTRGQVAELRKQRNELRAAVAILSQADTRVVKFGENQREPHGRVFISQAGGVVFVGSHLPALASGKTYELWLVPGKGNPQAAGLFAANPQGVSVQVLAKSIQPSDYAAVAVSIEPNGGSPQPSSKPILIVPLA